MQLYPHFPERLPVGSSNFLRIPRQIWNNNRADIHSNSLRFNLGYLEVHEMKDGNQCALLSFQISGQTRGRPMGLIPAYSSAITEISKWIDHRRRAPQELQYRTKGCSLLALATRNGSNSSYRVELIKIGSIKCRV